MTTARPAAVIVLAAGEGTRMKSAVSQGPARHRRPHPARARHRGRPRHRRRAPVAWSSGTSATSSRRTSPRSPPTPSSPTRTSVKGTGRATECALDALPGDLRRHRARHVRRRAAAVRATPCTGCSRRTPTSGSAATVITADAAPTRPATAGSCATPTARSPGSSSRRTPPTSSGRSARSTPASTPSTATVLRDALAQRGHRQRPGREVPHRRLAHRPRRRAAGSRAHLLDDLWQTEGVNDRVQLAAARAPSSTAGSSSGWMRDGVTVRRPRHHLDRRRRRARPRRDRPARHPAARRHDHRRRMPRSARTPR